MRWLRDQSLTLFFTLLFLAALIAQSIAGVKEYNEKAQAHGDELLSWARYIRSSEFGVAVLENWQSEYLQFFLFILATVWLVQKGSNESKKLDEIGLESDQKQLVKGYAKENSPAWAKVRDLRLTLYSNSLLLVMGVIFILSWLAQSITGWNEYNDEQRDHDEPTVTWSGYLGRPDFWERTFQNWQSEFLAVGSMAIFTVYLRQRGSPESKPVGSPHDDTAASG